MKINHLLKKAFLLLALVGGATSAWADDVTLFDVDFTQEDYEQITTTNSGATFVAKTYQTYNMSFGVKSGKSITILDNNGGLEFSGNNYNSYMCLAIPLTVTANKKITATITLPADGSIKYAWVAGTLPATPNAGSGTTVNTDQGGGSQTNTLEYTPTGTSCVLYLGRSGNNTAGAKVLSSIVITQEAASEAYTVSFNAGDHGTYTGGDIAEASAGAGITLPALTTLADGYAFNGWFTAASGGTKVGAAGDTYYPTASGTVYAQYSEEAVPSKPTISGAATVYVGTSVTLTASAESPLPITGYKWYKGNDLITGATAATYSPSTAEAGATSYKVVATNSIGDSEASDPVTVTVVGNKTATNNSYYVAIGEAAYRNQQIIGDDITMTFDNNADGAFIAGVSDTNLSAINANYVASIAGDNNSNGCGVTFTPSVNGVLSVGVIINGNKTFSITNVTSFNYNGVQDEGNNETSASAGTNNSGSWTPSKKQYTIITINVTAGTSYKFSVDGSKMSLYGFEFPAPSSVSGTITGAGWCSFTSSYPLDLSTISGGTAYYASLADAESVTLTPTGDVTVPAGEGLMIKGTPNASFTINVAASGTAIDGNLLEGQTATGTVPASPVSGDGTYHYVFGYESSSVYGFYNLASDTSVPAGKAYLEIVQSSGGARSLSIVYDEKITGIDKVGNGDVESSLPVKRIVNGKLVIEKKGMMFNANGQLVK